VTQSTLNPQRNYVEQILKLLSIDITLESLNQYQFLIWKNPFDPNSMQLTKHGYQIFRDKLTLEAKRFKIKPEHAKTKTYAIISKKKLKIYHHQLSIQPHYQWPWPSQAH